MRSNYSQLFRKQSQELFNLDRKPLTNFQEYHVEINYSAYMYEWRFEEECFRVIKPCADNRGSVIHLKCVGRSYTRIEANDDCTII